MTGAVAVPFPRMAQSNFPTHAENNIKGVVNAVKVKSRFRMFQKLTNVQFRLEYF